MPRLSKVARGICMWPRCRELRHYTATVTPGNESWVLDLYCKVHGPKVQAHREAQIAKEISR